MAPFFEGELATVNIELGEDFLYCLPEVVKTDLEDWQLTVVGQGSHGESL